jgi:hypothetical protein
MTAFDRTISSLDVDPHVFRTALRQLAGAVSVITAGSGDARAGCTLPETCQITGHSMASAHQIMKHYLASHAEIADNAIAKQVAWYDSQMDGSP